jgi:hypothetical protein
MEYREAIISNYIEGYNNFDIEQMTKDFSEVIIFQNIQNGKVSMTLNGMDAFKKQAKEAISYFSQRKQIVVSFNHFPDNTEIEIEYYGVLAMDFANGMKNGQEISLQGKSIFTFKENKIIRLIDES